MRILSSGVFNFYNYHYWGADPRCFKQSFLFGCSCNSIFPVFILCHVFYGGFISIYPLDDSHADPCYAVGLLFIGSILFPGTILVSCTRLVVVHSVHSCVVWKVIRVVGVPRRYHFSRVVFNMFAVIFIESGDIVFFFFLFHIIYALGYGFCYGQVSKRFLCHFFPVWRHSKLYNP